MRVFGALMAELPLVATKHGARRQGHCRVLMAAVEGRLASMGVPTLALPAAADAVPTWLNGFAFKHANPEELQAVQSEMRLFIFPGTQVGASVLARGGDESFSSLRIRQSCRRRRTRSSHSPILAHRLVHYGGWPGA